MDNQEHFTYSKENVQRLKDKYSKEMKDSDDNPIRICMQLIFSAAIEKKPDRRASLAHELSVFLTQPNGVINLFLALIDFDMSSQKVTTHNQRFIAIANIITRLPRFCLPYSEFCEAICKQLKPLLISDNTQYSSLAAIIVKSMFDSPYSKTEDITAYTLQPIFDGLSKAKSFYQPHESILATSNLISNRFPIRRFVNIFPHIFYAYITLLETPSRLKGPLKAVIVAIMRELKPGVSCCLLEETLFYKPDVSSLYRTQPQEEEISIELDDDAHSSDNHESGLQVEPTVLSLLDCTDNELLVLEFFFHFQEVMWTNSNEIYRQRSTKLIEPLLSMSIKDDLSKMNLLSIIANNRERSLSLISRTLLNYINLLRVKKQDDLLPNHQLVKHSLISCLNILEVLASVIDNSHEAESLKRKCVPILVELKNLLEDNEETGEIMKNLVSILHHLKKRDGYSESRNILINRSTESDEELNTIVKDLNDQLIPVQVHALVRLKQKVIANDQSIIIRIIQLLPVIEALLASKEPYVFLATINLLVELALRRTNEVLPKLISSHSQKDLDIQVRINVGEILVRLIKQLNETTPHYAQQVLNTLINNCKDPDELIRISSLTNIGEMCSRLGDSLERYIIDILILIESTILTDTNEVKCASIDLLRTTLSGLDKFTVHSIQRELKSIYDLLKRLKGRSLDERLCLQVDLALDEIDRIAKELFGVERNESIMSPTSLIKNIQMLNLIDR